MKYPMDFTDVIKDDGVASHKHNIFFIIPLSFVCFSSCNPASLNLKATEVHTTASVIEAMGKMPGYSNHLPTDLYHIAEKNKLSYVEGRLENEEIHDNVSLTTHQKYLALQYESAINTLYEGSMRDEGALKQVLDLIKYAPALFENNKMEALLRQRSEPLANFVTDFQVEMALSNPENVESHDDELKDVIIAEQKSAYDNLQTKFNALQAREKKLREQMEQLGKTPTPVTTQSPLEKSERLNEKASIVMEN